MAFKNQTNVKRQQIVDTRTIRKVSRNTNELSLVNGDRAYTDCGFTIQGSVTKNYETFYELMVAGTSGPVLTHPKKTRTYRVIEGAGYVFKEVEGTTQQKAIYAGDELTMEPGINYKFSTTANESLHLVVTQDSKYVAGLMQLSSSDSFVDAANIANRTTESLVDDRPRYSNRAADLQMQSRMQNGRSANISETPVVADPVMLNLRPSMGSFDSEGAG